MNKIIHKCLLTGDKFMLELHLKQPGFSIVLLDHGERIEKFRETGNLKHLYRNELDKACFAYDQVYSESKDLVKRIISDKSLKDWAYEIGRNREYNGFW